MLMRKQDIQDCARRTLVDHGLYSVPVNPVVVATKLGVRLVHAVFSESKYAGLTAHRGEGVTILIKNDDPPQRKRFTIAHEIGHMLLHLSDAPEEIIDADYDFFRAGDEAEATWTAEHRREYEANIFATELLMPRDLVQSAWANLPEAGKSVVAIAAQFQVSVQAMGYRLQELGLIK